MKAKSLQDLGAIRKQVNDAALAAAAAEEARHEAERRAEAEQDRGSVGRLPARRTAGARSHRPVNHAEARQRMPVHARLGDNRF